MHASTNHLSVASTVKRLVIGVALAIGVCTTALHALPCCDIDMFWYAEDPIANPSTPVVGETIVDCSGNRWNDGTTGTGWGRGSTTQCSTPYGSYSYCGSGSSFFYC